jgi:hypothetical protein
VSTGPAEPRPRHPPLPARLSAGYGEANCSCGAGLQACEVRLSAFADATARSRDRTRSVRVTGGRRRCPSSVPKRRGIGRSASFDLEKAFLFVGRRSIPRSVAVQCLPLAALESFVARFADSLPREGQGRTPWYDAPVGVVILSRELWHEMRGYDERLLYWGYTETDLAARIAQRHSVIDLERYLGCDFYHLRYSDRRVTITTRRKNPRRQPETYAPNTESWGLAECALALKSIASRGTSTVDRRGGDRADSHLRDSVAVTWERLVESCLGFGRHATALFR